MKIENEQDIIQLAKDDEWMMNILQNAKSLNLPDWWVCAGFVRSKIWDTRRVFNFSVYPERAVSLNPQPKRLFPRNVRYWER